MKKSGLKTVRRNAATEERDASREGGEMGEATARSEDENGGTEMAEEQGRDLQTNVVTAEGRRGQQAATRAEPVELAVVLSRATGNGHHVVEAG